MTATEWFCTYVNADQSTAKLNVKNIAEFLDTDPNKVVLVYPIDGDGQMLEDYFGWEYPIDCNTIDPITVDTITTECLSIEHNGNVYYGEYCDNHYIIFGDKFNN